MTLVLGEFLGPAGEHIAAAVSFRGELDYGAHRGVVYQLDRLVATLAAYLGDLLLPDALNPARAPGPHVDFRAAPARLALDRVARTLHPAAAAVQADGNAGAARPVVAHLAAAADHLAAGRDLLHTHFGDRPAGPQTAVSWWVPVITSDPVTAALLAELAGYTQTLASWIATPGMQRRVSSGAPTSAQLTLRAAEPWLRVAAVHIQAAQRQYYPPPARRLLGAIPLNVPPPRPPLGADERVAELCERIPVTAERLRHAALAFAPRARWSPAATSLSWRRDALASAITSHASELTRHPAGTGPTRSSSQPRRAAPAARGAGRQTAAQRRNSKGPHQPQSRGIAWLARYPRLYVAPHGHARSTAVRETSAHSWLLRAAIRHDHAASYLANDSRDRK